MKWSEFLARVNTQPIDGNVFCIDPGEHTGYASFHNAELYYANTINTPDDIHVWEKFSEIIRAYDPDIVVIEEYRIYEHKAMMHAQSTIPTLRYIGAIQMLCSQMDIPIFFQSASRAKSFCTDIKLIEWELLHPNEDHTNDAIRHGCAFYLFHPNARKVNAKTTT